MNRIQTKHLVKLLFVAFILNSCQEDVLPKPQAFLHLAYPVVDYHRFVNDCPFSFAISKASTIEFKDGCKALVHYPKQKASIHITYRRVEGNLNEILKEADKLTTKHTVKADAIIPRVFENKEKRVFGVLFDVQGQSASNIQFHLTDSSKHVVTAALYFKVQPNYDSIFPAIAYIKNDMIQMMETFEWKKE